MNDDRQPLLDELGAMLGCTPARSWEWDPRNRCWCLHGGASHKSLLNSVSLNFWDNHSYRRELWTIAHGPGVPGITAVSDPDEALALVMASVRALLGAAP